MNFTGKRVLVTGGTRGIGFAAVRAYLQAGASVAINGSSEASVAAAIARLPSDAAVFAAPGNLAMVRQCESVVAQAAQALGALDILVNNAGIGGDLKPIGQVTEEDWDAMMNVNLRAAYFCSKYAVPTLRAVQGNIVNIASILGLGGRGNGGSLYCTSKAGVINMTRDLAVELAPDIRVNCICPGAIDTDMLQELGRTLGQGDVAQGYAKITQNRPMKRVANPSEIANAILYVSSDLASFMTGSIHVVDGGVMAKAG